MASLGRMSEQERILVRAWRAADQKSKDAMEAAAWQILSPVTPQIKYVMRVREQTSKDVSSRTGVPEERVDRIRDADLESLKTFIRSKEEWINFWINEKMQLEQELLLEAMKRNDRTAVQDMVDMILICAWLEVPIITTIQDFLSSEIGR